MNPAREPLERLPLARGARALLGACEHAFGGGRHAPVGLVLRGKAWRVGASPDQHQRAAVPPAHHDYDADLGTYLTKASDATGHISVAAPLGSAVSVDGKVVGVAPLAEPVDVMAGAHTAEAQVGDVVLHGSVEAEAGKVTRVTLVAPNAPEAPPPAAIVPVREPAAGVEPARHSNPTREVLGWTTAGVAVVGVAVGVGFFAAERSQASDFMSFQSAHPQACAVSSSATCAQAHSQYSEISQRGDVSGVGFVVGGVAAATSAAIWLLWPKRSSVTTTWLRPSVGPGFYTLDVGGRF